MKLTAANRRSATSFLRFSKFSLMTPQSLPPVPTSIKQQRCVGSTFSSDVQSSVGGRFRSESGLQATVIG
jgi:hypothetical protein